jgi:methionyl-tRNA formyltransferase
MAKIGFIGCHEISWHCLRKISQLSEQFGDEISIVFNLEPEKGLKYSAYVNFDSLKQEFNFDLQYVSNVSDENSLKLLNEKKLDILFIIGWHKIVPQTVLNSAKIQLGIHSSLLPKNRGSSPINWQIIRNEKNGGTTLFHLTYDVDAGSIVDQEQFSIEFNDDIDTVYSKAIVASLNILERNWSEIHSLTPKNIPQDENEVTINEQRKPDDGLIDWTKNSIQCYNWVRALTHPYPGAFTFWGNKKILIWKCKLSEITNTQPGKIIKADNKIVISTGNKSIEIFSLQIENEPICNAEVFVKSYGLNTNDFFNYREVDLK